MAAPGLIIAAPTSGSGKTTVTLGLLRHLGQRGVRVASAKSGPDYIDPGFHTAAGGSSCVNLDSWGMRRATLDALIAEVSADADVLVIEGAMGLFDGAAAPGAVGDGSTADLAALTGWPVVLVADVRAQGQSVGALLHGFRSFRPDVRMVGAIFNRVGSARHEGLLRSAAEAVGVTLLGCLPEAPGIALPSRHLGLVQARETADLDALLDRAAELVGAHLDIDGLLRLAGPRRAAGTATEREPDARGTGLPPLGRRIAVARDDAFAFLYPHLLASWRAAGAEVAFFSPLADEGPEAGADAIYLPGGYPELHAGRLAANTRFLGGLRNAAERGCAIYGECGGYMVLGEGLVDAAGERHAMAGLLSVETSFAARRLHLGYRQVETLADGPLGPAGTRLRGHEFHYAAILREGEGERLFASRDAAGRDLGRAGLRRGSVSGSFVHLIDRA